MIHDAGMRMLVAAHRGVRHGGVRPDRSARAHADHHQHGALSSRRGAQRHGGERRRSIATRVGVEILKAGGNAVDAAVAVGFALAVTHPQAGNIGGGGFMLVHLAARNETIAIDYRETAPAAMTRDVFLDEKGEADPKKSRDSALGVGVPGTVAGLALAHERYGSGKFTLAQLIAPAIRLAREGFAVEDDLADSLPRAQPRLARWPASAKIFLKADGAPLGRGDTLVQTDLAASLRGDRRRRPARILSRVARREDRRGRRARTAAS